LTVDVVGVEPLTRSRKLVLAVEILAVYCRVRWLLWRKGFSATLDWARVSSVPAPAGRRADLAPLTGIRLGSVVTRTLRRLPTDSRCLMRSLVLTAMLARRGIRPNLVIGVRSDSEEEFAAHAWVELSDVELLPAGEQWGRLLSA
jgi:Transglutaminase-like superfamily